TYSGCSRTTGHPMAADQNRPRPCGSATSTTTAANEPVSAYSERGSSTQNSLPAGSASTTHGTGRGPSFCPMSAWTAPSRTALSTTAAWSRASAPPARSRWIRFFAVLGALEGSSRRDRPLSRWTSSSPLRDLLRVPPSSADQNAAVSRGRSDSSATPANPLMPPLRSRRARPLCCSSVPSVPPSPRRQPHPRPQLPPRIVVGTVDVDRARPAPAPQPEVDLGGITRHHHVGGPRLGVTAS